MSSYEAIDPQEAAAYFESRVDRQIKLETDPPTIAKLANEFEDRVRSSGVFRYFGCIYSPQSSSSVQLDIFLFTDADLSSDVKTQETIAELIDISDDLSQFISDGIDLRLHFTSKEDQPFDQYRDSLVRSCSPSPIGTSQLAFSETLYP